MSEGSGSSPQATAEQDRIFVADSPQFKQRIAELEQAREKAIEEWRAQGVPRELARIDSSPDGADSLGFLYERGIKKAEFIVCTKAQLESEMVLADGRLFKDCVWACGMLHTAGYQGELAVKLVNNKIVPLAARDIRRKMNEAIERRLAFGGFEDLTDKEKKLFHVEKGNLRAALAELEAEGRALRTLRDGTPLRGLPRERTKGLQEGDVLLFFFLRPVPPEPGGVVSSRLPRFALLSPFRAISDSLKLLELDLPLERVVSDDYLRAEVEAAVADYRRKEAEATRDYLKAKRVVLEEAKKRVSVVARRERIDIPLDSGRPITASSSSTTVEERTAEETTTTAPSLPPEPPPSQDRSGAATARAPLTTFSTMSAVAAALSIDADAAQRLVWATRKIEPSITAREIIALATVKLTQVREQIRQGKITNVVGFLIAAIPKMATGEPMADARKKARQDIERERREAQAIVEDPDFPEDLKADARAALRRLEAEGISS